ncbi:hypothetical protein [Janthinobacterium sp. HH01]|uniref:hypothetical protein n=1 Tax=Janthinobacterium sp. HH01 TaxID=1198452 RepID=UPI00034D750A|nr:hypothetical protein [Janthinobacterium sp. HH01]
MILNQCRGRIIELHSLSTTRTWRRRGWLALIGGLHLLAFLCWRAPERPLAAAVGRHEAITYILAPAKRPQPKPIHEPRAPREARVAAAPRMTLLPAPQQPQPVQPPAQPAAPPAPQAITQAVPAPDPFALPSDEPAEDLRQRALKSAAAADRQLRKEAWHPDAKKIANDSTPLSAAVASAYVGNDQGFTTENLSTPDGRMMTKVRTLGGSTYCGTKQSNNSTAIDPFRDGVKTFVATCPKPFGK